MLTPHSNSLLLSFPYTFNEQIDQKPIIKYVETVSAPRLTRSGVAWEIHSSRSHNKNRVNPHHTRRAELGLGPVWWPRRSSGLSYIFCFHSTTDTDWSHSQTGCRRHYVGTASMTNDSGDGGRLLQQYHPANPRLQIAALILSWKPHRTQ